MVNARFHTREDIVEVIRAQEFILEFLPAYSPDLNPIEHKWVEVKATRRRERCGIDELFKEHVSYANLY